MCSLIISVLTGNTEPILIMALKDTLLIQLELRALLEQIFESARISHKKIQKQLKYIKTQREVFKQLCDKIDEFDTRPSAKSAFEEIDHGYFEK